MPHTSNPAVAVCLSLTRAIAESRTVEEIYQAALDAIAAGLRVERASILLFDPDGVMRFKAWRGLSEAYRRAVEGHTPWTPDSPDPQPIVVSDVRDEPTLAALLPTISAEGIAAMAFVPLVTDGRVIGKFMLYADAPRAMTRGELELAGVIAAQVAFAVARTRAEEQARRSEERLRFALDAANMGTWDWEIGAPTLRWSDNLERIHGLPPGTFDGTFASYEREIHPEDRERVLASIRRAIEHGVPHDVEYRIVSPDGVTRWVEGKGRVEFEDGRPVRMTGVCMNVTRRKEAELARLEAAHETARLKDEFLAVLSHELRTPLNAIVGWVQLLQSGTLGEERAAEAIAIISRNARLQSQLIEDILDVSRIAAGKLDLDRRPLMPEGIIRSAVTAIGPAATARRIGVTLDLAPDLPPIDADARRLEQVLGNLLANAVKFTPEGGTIAVRGRHAAGRVTIEVEDSGVGIAPELLPFVFDRFRQGDSRTTRRHGGLGLGLAIARHLVEQHDGEISARSDGPGRGSTFTVSLPAAGIPLPQAPIDAADVETAGATLAGLRILVVDDDADARNLVRVLLEERGAEAWMADCAGRAVEACACEPFDVLIADIAMPDVDGYALVRDAKRLQPALRAIALTACARDEDRARALAAGFDAYEAKPFDVSRLLSTVRQTAVPTARTAAGGS